MRVFIGRASTLPAPEELRLIEANLDDLNPELFPYVIDRLIEAGARDAWVTPVVMKKGRNAQTLSVLCQVIDVDRLSEIVFRETSTLGLRVVPTERRALERSQIEVSIDGHAVSVKLGLLAGEVVNLAPEFEDARRAATALGRPLKDVYSEAVEKARRTL